MTQTHATIGDARPSWTDTCTGRTIDRNIIHTCRNVFIGVLLLPADTCDTLVCGPFLQSSPE